MNLSRQVGRFLIFSFVLLMGAASARAACDWLAEPNPDRFQLIASRLACLQDPYSKTCADHDPIPRQAREDDRLRRIAALGLGEEEARHLVEGGLWLGVSRDMACLAWGKPHRLEEVPANRVFGQVWVYGEVDRLIFDGDALVEIRTRDAHLVSPARD